GLSELGALGSALADLKYTPPSPWLRRALAAAGTAALAAAAADTGMVALPSTAAAVDAIAPSALSDQTSPTSQNGLPQPPPPPPQQQQQQRQQSRGTCSSDPLPGQLSYLLWRWGAVAAAMDDADANGAAAAANGSTAGDVAAAVERFAGQMAAATAPLLVRMGPLQLVRCAEGMALLQQLLKRLKAAAGVSRSSVGAESFGSGGGIPGAAVVQHRETLLTAALGLAAGEPQAVQRLVQQQQQQEQKVEPNAVSGGRQGSSAPPSSTGRGLALGTDQRPPQRGVTGLAGGSDLAVAEAVQLRQQQQQQQQQRGALHLLERPTAPLYGTATAGNEAAPSAPSACHRPAIRAGDATGAAAAATSAASISARSKLSSRRSSPLDFTPWWQELERATANVLVVRPQPPPSSPQGTMAAASAATKRPMGRSSSDPPSPPQLSPYNLSVTLRCMAAAGYVPSTAWLQRYCQHTQPLLPSYKPVDLAASLWAFANMRLANREVFDTGGAAAAAADAHSGRRNQGVGQTASAGKRHKGGSASAAPAALASAPRALAGWLGAATLALGLMLHQCKGNDLQNCLWALGSLDFTPSPGWLVRYERATYKRLPYLDSPALLYSLWAFARFGYAPSGEYMEAMMEALRPRLLGTPPSSPPPAAPAAATPAGTATPATCPFPPPQPPLPPPPHHQQPQQLPAPPTAPAPAAALIPPAAGPSQELLDGQSLALLLHSLSQLDYLPGEQWLREYLQAVLRALPAASALGLTITMRAIATLQIYPTPAWLDVMLEAARRRLPYFSQQQLEALLSALADLDAVVRPSPAVLRTFLWGCLSAAPDNRKIAAFYRMLNEPPDAAATAVATASVAEAVAAAAEGEESPMMEQQELGNGGQTPPLPLLQQQPLQQQLQTEAPTRARERLQSRTGVRASLWKKRPV
ncbi:hypothetical protein Agub_g6712, partial [Astrephomene gubernaculifera]